MYINSETIEKVCFPGSEGIEPPSPERSLMAAMLYRAIVDFAIYSERSPFDERLARLRRWFQSDNATSDVHITFTGICQALYPDWEGMQDRIRNFLQAGNFEGFFQKNGHVK